MSLGPGGRLSPRVQSQGGEPVSGAKESTFPCCSGRVGNLRTYSKMLNRFPRPATSLSVPSLVVVSWLARVSWAPQMMGRVWHTLASPLGTHRWPQVFYQVLVEWGPEDAPPGLTSSSMESEGVRPAGRLPLVLPLLSLFPPFPQPLPRRGPPCPPLSSGGDRTGPGTLLRESAFPRLPLASPPPLPEPRRTLTAPWTGWKAMLTQMGLQW